MGNSRDLNSGTAGAPKKPRGKKWRWVLLAAMGVILAAWIASERWHDKLAGAGACWRVLMGARRFQRAIAP
jgi:hypothetical protein